MTAHVKTTENVSPTRTDPVLVRHQQRIGSTSAACVPLAVGWPLARPGVSPAASTRARMTAARRGAEMTITAALLLLKRLAQFALRDESCKCQIALRGVAADLHD